MERREPIVGQSVTVTASIVTLKSLLAGTAFQRGTNILTLFNTSDANKLYFAIKGSAPAAVAEMAWIPPGQAYPFRYDPKDLENLYVAGEASQSAYALEDRQVL